MSKVETIAIMAAIIYGSYAAGDASRGPSNWSTGINHEEAIRRAASIYEEAHKYVEGHPA